MKRGTKIIHNRVRCKNCGETIESMTRHDWVCCKCFHESNGMTGVFCDGGKDYRRWGGDPMFIEDLSEVRPFTDEEVDEYNNHQLELVEKYGKWFNVDLMEKE